MGGKGQEDISQLPAGTKLTPEQIAQLVELMKQMEENSQGGMITKGNKTWYEPKQAPQK